MADTKWVAGLSDHRAGRLLARHLVSVQAARTPMVADSAVQEVLSNEKVFVYALARSLEKRKPYPCGLAFDLPRFVAIINLSGERLLVYSNSPALIRCLCAHSAVLHPSELEQAREAFETFPRERTDTEKKFVLLTYSMPWQAGVDAAFWHLSACTVDEKGLKDRLWHFSSVSTCRCEGKSVRDPRDASVPLHAQGPLALVGDAEIAAFCDTYSATSLDQAPAVEGTEGAGGTHAHPELVRTLVLERKKDQAEIKHLKEQLRKHAQTLTESVQETLHQEKSLKAEHAAAMAKAEKDAEEVLEVAREQHAALCLEMKSIELNYTQTAKELRKTKKDNERLLAQHDEMVRKCAAKDTLHNAALSQHVATISRLEGRVATSGQKAEAARAELERGFEATLTSEREAHAAALQKLTLALESKERICNQLSENNERRDVEVESHKTHQAEQDRRIADLEARNKALSQKLSARPKPTPTRTVGILCKKNASTSTHQCASTQTDPVPELAVGAKVVEPVPPPAPSYQSAIDVLQELVTSTGHAHPMQLAPPLNGYAPRPLPFPNFVPNVGYYDANGHPMRPQFAPHQRGPY